MFNLRLEKINGALVKSVRLCVAVRKFFGEEAVEYAQFMDVEREMREAAGDVQKAQVALVEGGGFILIDR